MDFSTTHLDGAPGRTRRLATRVRLLVATALAATGVIAAPTTEAATPPPPAAADEINGLVWLDVDADGVNDPDESGFAGATVELLVAGSVVATHTTLADGFYSFPGLTGPGYEVRVTAPTLYTISAGGPDQEFDRGASPEVGLSATIAPGASVDAAVRPQWETQLGMVGGAPLTGTAPFDTADPLCPGDNPAPGHDCGSDDLTVRSQDAVFYTWSVSAANPEPVLNDPVSDVILEQVLTPDPGVRLEIQDLPTSCTPAGGGGTAPPSSVTTRADGSIVVLCNLGEWDTSGIAKILTIGVDVLPSPDGGTFTSDAQVYAVDSTVDPQTTPTTRTVVNAVPSNSISQTIEVSAGFAYDLEKHYYTRGVGYFDHDSDPSTPSLRGRTLTYFFGLSSPQRGNQQLAQPITFSDDMFFATGTTTTPFADLEHYVQSCYRNTSGISVLPYGYFRLDGSRSVVSSGICTFGRSDTSDPTSPYTFSIDGIDDSGQHFPEHYGNGSGDLTNGPYYIGAWRMNVFVPDRAIDTFDGTPGDLSGSGWAWNRLTDFDPVSTTGATNDNGAGEPGRCDSTVDPYSTDPMESGCVLMPDTTASNNVGGPAPLSIAAPTWGSYANKYNYSPRAGATWTSNGAFSVEIPNAPTASHNGLGIVGPGDAHIVRLYASHGGEIGLRDMGLCDIFDNTVERLGHPSELAVSGTPPTDYVWHFGNYGGPTGVLGSQLSDFEIVYGHIPLTGDDPLAGPVSTLTGRYQGDWTEQRDASCWDSTPTNGWQTDPNLVSDGVTTGLDAVNAVYIRSADPDAIYGFTQSTSRAYVYAAFTLVPRHTFYGGPNDGEMIPNGTVMANFLDRRYIRDGNDIHTVVNSNYAAEPENTSRYGDRFTIGRSAALVQKRTIEIDGIGDGASAFGATGAAFAGNPIVWEIVPTLNSLTDPPAMVNDISIVDVLPAYTMYDPTCTATITGGTPPDLVEPDTPSAGQTRLTWYLPPQLPGEPMDPLRVCTQTDGLAPSPVNLVNTVTLSSPELLTSPSDTHTVTLSQVGILKLFKYVDRALDELDDDQVYTISAENFSDVLALAGPTFIEVFPFNGDGSPPGGPSRAPGSEFSGSVVLTAEPTAYWDNDPADAAAAGTFEFTADDPTTINQDVNVNASTWCTHAAGAFTLVAGSGPCPTSLADVTGFKFVSADSLASQSTASGTRSRISIDFTLQAAGNDVDEWYANAFTVTSPDLRVGTSASDPLQVLYSNRVEVATLGFVIGDLVFLDGDGDGAFDPLVDHLAPDGTIVHLYDPGADGIADPAADTQLASTTTTGGLYRFDGLLDGDYYTSIPASEFQTGGSLAGWVAVVGDPTEDIDDDDSSDTSLLASGDVVSGIHSLTYAVIGGFPFGEEPLGDNLHSLPLSPTTFDGFTNLTLDFAATGSGRIGDLVWWDVDGDGTVDPGEDGLEGLTVQLTWFGADGVAGGGDDLVWTTTTDTDGTYEFEYLPAGDFEVAVTPPVGMDETVDYDGVATPSTAAVSLTAGEENLDVDFGYDVLFSVGDLVFLDVDRDGSYDAADDELVPDGVTVELYDADGTRVGTTTTSGGAYHFDELPAGDYYVVIPATEFAVGATLEHWSATPIHTPDPDGDIDDDANGYDDPSGVTAGGVRTGVFTLSAVYDADTTTIDGDEPDGGGLANLTVDIGLQAPVEAEIAVEKSTNGADADIGTGPLALVGSDVVWDYRVTNEGTTALKTITIVDDNGTPTDDGDDFAPTYVSGDTDADGVLDLNETWLYRATGTAVAGQYGNTAAVTGTPSTAGGTTIPDEDPVGDDDPSHYFGVRPTIDIEKEVQTVFDADTASGPMVAVDDDVLWEFTITNTGTVGLGSISVVDDNGTSAVDTDDVTITITSGDTDDDGVLDVGETWIGTLTGTATAGAFVNSATVTGTPVDSGGDTLVDYTSGDDLDDVSDTDVAHHFGADPGIDIEKTTNTVDADTAPGPLVAVDGDVVWTYTVTNTGNVPLRRVAVTDDVEGAPTFVSGDTNDDGLLDTDETWVYRLTGTAEAGQYDNNAEVTADGPLTWESDGTPANGVEVSDDDDSHYFGVDPGMRVEKSTNGVDADAAPGPSVTEGGDVVWLFTVTNTGNVALADIEVDDDIEGAPTFVSGDTNDDGLLDTDETWTYRIIGTAGEGAYANVGSVTGSGPDTVGTDGSAVDGAEVEDDDPSHHLGVDAGIQVEKTTNTVDADTAPGPLVAVGGDVVWTYTVTNTGNVPLSDVDVDDDVEGAPTYVSGDIDGDDHLDPDETWVYRLTGSADEGQYVNTATATGTAPDTVDENGDTVAGVEVSDGDASHYLGVEPDIDVEVSTNTFDADTGTGPLVAVGGDVVWTYTVTNPGNVPLSDVALTDSELATAPTHVSGDTNDDGLLDPDETWIYQATGTATAGQYGNTAEVTGTGPDTVDTDGGTVDGREVSDEDPTHHFGVTVGIDIETATNTLDADAGTGPLVAVGDDVEWVYVVTNTGNVPLSDVVVGDSELATAPVYLSGDTNNDGLLGPDETWTYRATGTAAAGQYANTGSVEGSGPDTIDETGGTVDGAEVSDDDPTHHFGVETGIDIEKSTDGADADTAPGPYLVAGDEVTWTYTVTNTGNVALDAVAVSDDVEGAATSVSGDTDDDGLLDPDETWIFEIDGIVGTGQYVNEGTATAVGPETTDTDGDPVDGDEVSDDDLSHHFGSAARIDIVKRTQTVFDADDGTGPNVAEGATVRWTYTVENAGGVALADVEVVDDVEGAADYVSGDADLDGLLDTDETWTFEILGTAVAGQYENVGTATGTAVEPDGTPILGADGDEVEVSDDDPARYFGVAVGIDVVKRTNDTLVDPATDTLLIAAGDDVRWTYTVTNTGNVALSDVDVDDIEEGVADYVSGDTDLDGLLDLDEIWIFELRGVAAAGDYQNEARASGTGPATHAENGRAVDGADATDVAESGYFGTDPGIEIEKTTNGLDSDQAPGDLVAVGAGLTWRYAVTNAGNVPLAGVAVVDDVEGAPVYVSGDADLDGLLDLAEVWVFELTGTAVRGQYENLGSVTAVGPATVGIDGAPVDGVELAADDPSHVFGAEPTLNLNKRVNGDDADEAPGQGIAVGTAIEWTYEVVNDGNTWLIDIVVSDDQGVVVTCPATSLAPGASMICTGDGVAEAGPYVNIGAVTATPGERQDPSDDTSPLVALVDPATGERFPDVSADDPAHHVGLVASVEIDKLVCTLPDGCDPDGEGWSDSALLAANSEVRFRITVTNDGESDLSDLTVTDHAVEACDADVPDLAPGESYTYTCTQAQLVEEYVNEAQVVGVSPSGEEVSDDDDAEVGILDDVAISKQALGEATAVGDHVAFRLTVTNTGPRAIGDVDVVDDLPTGMSVVDAGTGRYDSGRHELSWTIPTLPAGGSTTLDYTVSIDRAGEFENIALIDGCDCVVDQNTVDGQPGERAVDADLSNNTSVASVEVGIPSRRLPYTGGSVGQILMLGALLTIVGLVVLAGSRRRRDGETIASGM